MTWILAARCAALRRLTLGTTKTSSGERATLIKIASSPTVDHRLSASTATADSPASTSTSTSTSSSVSSSSPPPAPTTNLPPTVGCPPPEPPHLKAIVDQISELKFYEVTLLNDLLKHRLKIPDLQRVVATGVAGGAAASQEAGEDSAESTTSSKSSFTVKLMKFDDSKKVTIIKEIKKLVEGINLVEAKRFVEDCPKVIKVNLAKNEADALAKQLTDAGGVVKIE